MKYQMFGVALVATIRLAVTGCGKKKPADMPETFPFTVTVVDGSTPIAGAQVLLIDGKNPVVNGETDAKGVAKISTTLQGYTQDGAPAGDFRVQVTKEPLAEHWKTPEEQAQMSKPEKDAYIDEWLKKCEELPREVPKIWGDFDKTPLKASVSAGGGEVTFDVEGKANN